MYTYFCLMAQVERPITMKKDGIQTRNRKLSLRGLMGKKSARRYTMEDYLRPALVAGLPPPNATPFSALASSCAPGSMGMGMGMGMGLEMAGTFNGFGALNMRSPGDSSAGNPGGHAGSGNGSGSGQSSYYPSLPGFCAPSALWSGRNGAATGDSCANGAAGLKLECSDASANAAACSALSAAAAAAAVMGMRQSFQHAVQTEAQRHLQNAAAVAAAATSGWPQSTPLASSSVKSSLAYPAWGTLTQTQTQNTARYQTQAENQNQNLNLNAGSAVAALQAMNLQTPTGQNVNMFGWPSQQQQPTHSSTVHHTAPMSGTGVNAGGGLLNLVNGNSNNNNNNTQEGSRGASTAAAGLLDRSASAQQLFRSSMFPSPAANCGGAGAGASAGGATAAAAAAFASDPFAPLFRSSEQLLMR